MNGDAARTATRIVLSAGLAIALAASGCGRASQPSRKPVARAVTFYAVPKSTEPADLAGAEAANAFGFDLMRSQLAETSSARGNVVLSPLSVHAALSMTLQGARGDTAAEMQRTLHLSGDATAAASTYSLLLSALDDRSKEQTLSVANALWIDKTLAVKPEFLNANRISFGASARTLDFQHDNVASIVNAWVAEKTRGMITQMLDHVDPNAVMLLGDAVYFKASWANAFDPTFTRPQPFHPADATTPVSVQMMHDTTELPVVKTASFSATRLDYRGGDSEAYLVLPDQKHRLDDVLAGLTSARFAELRDRLDSSAPTLTALALPKFDTGVVGGDVAPVLASLGMPTAFDPDKADFSGIATPTPGAPIFIGGVVHKARIKVEEKGTEAAAATIVEMYAGAHATPRQPVPLPFICDRPFAFVIVDKPTGAILFLAAIRNPKAS